VPSDCLYIYVIGLGDPKLAQNDVCFGFFAEFGQRPGLLKFTQFAKIKDGARRIIFRRSLAVSRSKS
jgi:hypothetical protein